MPPRRTTYESGRIGMVNIPSVDFSQYKAQANLFSDINKRLDTLTAYAIERGTEEAQSRAASNFLKEFEQNPNYVEDFLNANEQERQRILTSDDDTLYGQKTRQLGLDVIENALTNDAISSMKINKSLALNSNESPEEFLQSLDAITEEMLEPLAAYPERYLSARKLLKEQAQESYADFLQQTLDRQEAVALAAYTDETKNVTLPIPIEGDVYGSRTQYKGNYLAKGYSINANQETLNKAMTNIDTAFNTSASNISTSIANLTDKSPNKFANRAMLLEAIRTRNSDGKFDELLGSMTKGNTLYNEKDLSTLYKFRNMLENFTEDDISNLIDQVVLAQFEQNDQVIQIQKDNETRLTNNAVDTYEYLLLLQTNNNAEDIEKAGFSNGEELNDQVTLAKEELLSRPGGAKLVNDTNKEVLDSSTRVSTVGVVDELKFALPRFDSGAVDRIQELKKIQRTQGFLTIEDLNGQGFNDLDLPTGVSKLTISSKDFVTLQTTAETEDNDDFKVVKRTIAGMVNNPTLTASLENYSYKPDDINFRQSFQNNNEAKAAYELYQTLVNRARLLFDQGQLNDDALNAMVLDLGNTTLNNRTGLTRTNISALISQNNELVTTSINDMRLSEDVRSKLSSYEKPFVIRFDLYDEDSFPSVYDLSDLVGGLKTVDDVDASLSKLVRLESDLRRVANIKKEKDQFNITNFKGYNPTIENLVELKESLLAHKEFLLGYDIYSGVK